jgi:hypothetical protein
MTLMNSLDVSGTSALGPATASGSYGKCAMRGKAVLDSIEFRRGTNKNLPDSIIAATSIVANAVLITRDKEPLKLNFSGLHTMPVGLKK